MSHRTKAIFIIILIMIFQFLTMDSASAKKNKDLFSEIISCTNAQIVEYGIKAEMETERNGEDACLFLLNKLNLQDNGQITVFKKEDVYSIEFKKNNLEGYIENINYDNHNVVTINIVEHSTINKLEELRGDIERNISKDFKKIKIFQYLKAQIYSSSDISSINDKVRSVLKLQGAKNIDSLKISNGFSGMALTDIYSPMKLGGKWIDFNYAVCRYTDDKYLIIGTPIITITY